MVSKLEQSTPTDGVYLDTKGACAYLKCSRFTIERMVKDGRLVRYKVLSSNKYKKEDLDALVQPVK